MSDIAADIAFWALIIVLLYFGPPLLVYAVAMFISWGANWNPAEWGIDTRGAVAFFWGVWAFVATMFLMEFS